MDPEPLYNSTDRSHVHSRDPGAQFAHVATAIETAVRDLVRDAGVTNSSRVLDYGCAERPYRHVLPRDAQYVGADLTGNPQADLELSADGTIPTPDGSFDVVLSTQVLEHVADPVAYLRECARVLGKQGTLVLTTHGMMWYHPDPEDYWRWTSSGLRRIVGEAGFDVAELRGVVGLSATSVQLFQDATSGRVPTRLRRPYQRLLQTVIRWLDHRETPEARSYNALVFAVRAVKRS